MTNSDPSQPAAPARHTGVQGLAEVLESISDAFFSLDREWRFTYLNSAAERLLFRRREELLGRSVWDEFPAALGSSFDTQYHRAVAENVTVEFEELYAPLETWFSVRAYPTPSGLSVYFQNFNERRRTQQALRESEERAREVADRLGFALAAAELGDWEWDASTDLMHMSPRAAEIVGIPPNAPQTRAALRLLLPEEDRERARLAMEQAPAGGGRYSIDYRVNRPDGVQVWVSASGRSRYDAQGRIVGMTGIIQDITERKHVEEQLRRSHDTFYNLIRDDPFGVYVVDADFRLREVSAGAQKVFSAVRPLLGRDFADVLRVIWTEPFATEAIARFRHTLETGEPYASSRTVELRQNIPEVEAYDWRIERITLPDGRFGVVCYFYDLSERQRWEAALRASEARLRTSEERLALAVSAADIGTFYCPMPLGEIIWNDTCKAHFWLPADARVDFELFYSIIHPDDRERTRECVERAIYGREPYDVEYRTVAPDGQQRWVRAKGRAYYTQSGEPLRFDGVTLDVTDRRRVEDELRRLATERQQLLEGEQAARAEAERASRMKDDFLATLSHELRTPLNAILGWSQILRNGAMDGEDLAQGLETIERNARAQTQIIEDLLDMSRIISGKVRLDVQRVDLAALVQAAVDSVRPAAEAKGVRVSVVLDPLGGPISGDPTRLQQIFWNLLSNAVKFTPRDGRIQVVLERVNSHLEVRVLDSGEGIAPEFLPHVFDRFRQADPSTTRRHGGLGLGLAIVKQLVELHGGRVRAESAGRGQGSTFAVLLPQMPLYLDPTPATERRHPSAESMPAVRDACADLAGVRVLVVDDEPDARAMVKRLLEDCGAKVTVAATVEEAIALVQSEHPDVLVSDIGMPGEDGYSLIRRIRAMKPEEGGNLPAVALTAYARAEDRMKAIMAGFQHHVAKPVEPAELITMVASLSKRPA